MKILNQLTLTGMAFISLALVLVSSFCLSLFCFRGEIKAVFTKDIKPVQEQYPIAHTCDVPVKKQIKKGK